MQSIHGALAYVGNGDLRRRIKGPSGDGIRPFIGDYDGIVSTPATVGMTWIGPSKTYGALPTNLEVYFASVRP